MIDRVTGPINPAVTPASSTMLDQASALRPDARPLTKAGPEANLLIADPRLQGGTKNLPVDSGTLPAITGGEGLEVSIDAAIDHVLAALGQ